MKFLLEAYDKEFDKIPFEKQIQSAKEEGVKEEDIFDLVNGVTLMNPDEYIDQWYKEHNIPNDNQKVLNGVMKGRTQHREVLANYLDSIGLHQKYDKIPPATLEGKDSDGRWRATFAKVLGIKVPVIIKKDR